MQKDTRQFWFGWTFVTLIGYVIGTLAVLPIVITLTYTWQPPSMLGLFLIGLLSGAALGATSGLAQWFLLRRRTPVTASWVGASILGGMIGMALGMTLTSAPATSMADTRDAARSGALLIPWSVVWQTSVQGALFGVGMGLAQWWILRQFARSAGWWIVVNGFGWMIGLGVGAALAPFITPLGAMVVTSLLAAAITGYRMERWQWEMRKRSGPIPGRR